MRTEHRSVSVIIPAFNAETYLASAIASALGQSCAVTEIIVVDDGSTDSTAAVARRYGDRVRLIQQRNRGLSAARNVGLASAHGMFIVFLDADDILFPDMVASTTDLLQRTESADIACAGCVNLSPDASPLTKPSRPLSDRRRICAYYRSGLFNPFVVHQLLFRRSVFACCGAFDESLRRLEDWDLWIRLARHGHEVAFTNVLGAGYRRHMASMSFDIDAAQAGFDAIATKHYSSPRVPIHIRATFDILASLTIARYSEMRGAKEQAARCITDARRRLAAVVIPPNILWTLLSQALGLAHGESLALDIACRLRLGIGVRYWIRARADERARRFFSASIELTRALLLSPRFGVSRLIQRLRPPAPNLPDLRQY